MLIRTRNERKEFERRFHNVFDDNQSALQSRGYVEVIGFHAVELTAMKNTVTEMQSAGFGIDKSILLDILQAFEKHKDLTGMKSVFSRVLSSANPQQVLSCKAFRVMIRAHIQQQQKKEAAHYYETMKRLHITPDTNIQKLLKSM